MSTTDISTTNFDVAALRRGFAERDAGTLASLYADDATREIADAQNPPSRPARVEGIAAITAQLEEVMGRDMTHELDIVAVSADAVGYTLRCRYPDGLRVLCAATAQLRDGKIVREVGVQAWDS
jgi:hypothetical protein